jgi:hypothetical protein
MTTTEKLRDLRRLAWLLSARDIDDRLAVAQQLLGAIHMLTHDLLSTATGITPLPGIPPTAHTPPPSQTQNHINSPPDAGPAECTERREGRG